MKDSFGRTLEYLRVSVTDRCNLRCQYCIPDDYAGTCSSTRSLHDDELVYLLHRFAESGISKIRLTGGEPLVRPRILRLIESIAAIPGIQDLALSTNGVLLGPMARDLAAAGLRRVNVSLDTLRPERYREITRYGRMEDVRAGIEAAVEAGLAPVKINVVVARGMNEDEISDFIDLTQDAPLHVRLIELMPMGDTGFFSRKRWVPLEEMRRLAGDLAPLDKPDWPFGHGPARYFQRIGFRGTVGFIHALSCSFCGDCNRMRLDHDGVLWPCLDGAESVDLKTPLRSGADAAALRSLISLAADRKPECHDMLNRVNASARPSRTMCSVGG